MPPADLVSGSPSVVQRRQARRCRVVTGLARARPPPHQGDLEIRGGHELDVREDASLLITQRVEHCNVMRAVAVLLLQLVTYVERLLMCC